MQINEFPSTKPLIEIPNWVLYLLFFTYALPGTLGHVPWRGDDALHIGLTVSLLRENHWAIPSLGSSPYLNWGPLTYWIGAIAGKVFGQFLPLHDAIRLSMVGWTGVFIASLRYCARDLYGRDAATAATLLAFASLGLLIHAHEMQPQIVFLACLTATLAGLARMKSAPTTGAWMSGIGCTSAFLCAGVTGLALTILLIAANASVSREFRTKYVLKKNLLPLVATCLAILAWPLYLALTEPNTASLWWSAQTRNAFPHTSHFQELRTFIGLISWFVFPIWPVALWSLWRCRGRYMEYGHTLPVLALCFTTVLVLTTGTLRPANLLPLLPPFILLAAPELCKLRRGATNAFDWFGIITFSMLGIFLWLAWSGLNLGWPTGLAKNVQKVLPGYQTNWTWFECLVAISLSCGWVISLIKVPFFQLRGAIHWAIGVTLAWGISATLWLSWIDYDKNHQAIATKLQQSIKAEAHDPTTCISARGLGDAQKAGLYYFANIKLSSANDSGCEFLLTYASGRRELPLVEQGWELSIYEQKGSKRFAEKFALYHRTK